MSCGARLFLLVLALATGFSSAAPAGVAGFSFNGVSNRFITPNGDGRNDDVAFNYCNPYDSAGTVKIYDLRGHLLTTLPISSGGSLCGSVVWNARVNGTTVSTGVYLFVVAVESSVNSGAVVVIR